MERQIPSFKPLPRRGPSGPLSNKLAPAPDPLAIQQQELVHLLQECWDADRWSDAYPVLCGLSETITKDCSELHPYFSGDEFAEFCKYTFVLEDQLLVWGMATVLIKIVGIFGFGRVPNFTDTEFLELCVSALSSQNEISKTVIHLLAVLSSQSEMISDFLSTESQQIVSFLASAVDWNSRIFAFRCLLSVLRLRPELENDNLDLFLHFLDVWDSPPLLKVVIFECLLVKMESGFDWIADSLDMKYLDDESAEVVICALKIAPFRYNRFVLDDAAFERMLELIDHPLDSMRVQAMRTLTSILIQVPSEFRRVDPSVFKRCGNAMRKATFDHRNDISFFIASLVCSVPDAIVLESIVPSLLPCFLNAVRFSEIERGRVLMDAVAKICAAMSQAGRIAECTPAFEDFVEMNETEEMPDGTSEFVSLIEAYLRPDDLAR
jgi:hypothetical protein